MFISLCATGCHMLAGNVSITCNFSNKLLINRRKHNIMGNKSTGEKIKYTSIELNIPCCIINGYFYLLPLENDLTFDTFSTVGIDLMKIYNQKIKRSIQVIIEGKTETIEKIETVDQFHLNFEKAFKRIKYEGTRYPEEDPCYRSPKTLRVYFIRPEMKCVLYIREDVDDFVTRSIEIYSTYINSSGVRINGKSFISLMDSSLSISLENWTKIKVWSKKKDSPDADPLVKIFPQ
jgi:hypothetical protein